MKTQTIVILCVCVVVVLDFLIIGFLVASYFTSQLIAQKNAKVMLVVAKHHYAKGTAIKDPEQMFEYREFLASDAPWGSIIELKALRDQTLTNDIQEGEPLVVDLLQETKKAPRSVLFGDLEPGKRAILVKTKARAGLIQVGSRVDVIYSNPDGGQKSEAKILLRNILVRAIEQPMLDDDNKIELVPLLVTLDVTPEEALVLAPIKETGNVTLTNRPKEDTKKLDVP